MTDLQHYEFANEAFYLAFEAKDYSAMEHIWCEQGQPRLFASWLARLSWSTSNSGKLEKHSEQSGSASREFRGSCD